MTNKRGSDEVERYCACGKILVIAEGELIHRFKERRCCKDDACVRLARSKAQHRILLANRIERGKRIALDRLEELRPLREWPIGVHFEDAAVPDGGHYGIRLVARSTVTSARASSIAAWLDDPSAGE